MRFFRATVKGVKSDEDLETILTLRVSGEEYEKVTPVGKLVRQNLVVAVYTEDEFLEFSARILEKETEHG